jgi:hypothetical protein
LGKIFLEPETIQTWDFASNISTFVLGSFRVSTTGRAAFVGTFAAKQALRNMYSMGRRKRVINVLMKRIEDLDGRDAGNGFTHSAQLNSI